MSIVQALLSHPVAVAFLIIVLGHLLGRARVAGLSLGASGVLFIALALGHFELADPQPLKPLGDFGVVLFVYAIGLQAGPHFARTFRAQGRVALAIGLGTVGGAAALTALLGGWWDLEAEVIVGVFAGALTSTPALAAATEASDSPLVAVAYGLAYPFGVVVVVLFAQFIPHWLKRSGRPDEPGAWSSTNAPLVQRCFLVENPGCVGKPLSTLRLSEMVTVNISRVMRGDEVHPATADLVLNREDIVLVVGAQAQLTRLELLLGPSIPLEAEVGNVPGIASREVTVTSLSFVGRSLSALRPRAEYGVTISRVRREELEFIPRGDYVFEVGDQLRVVGHAPEVDRFAERISAQGRRVYETGIPAFAVGLVAGLLLGFTPIHLPGVGTIKLGLAGGPLFAGIVFAHFGRIGTLRIYVPPAARYLIRELGLVLFLASAGVSAGANLGPVIEEQGVVLVALAAASAALAVALGFILSYVVFGMSVAASAGLTCGAMTSTPGLGAATAQFETDTPTLAYVAVYPLALVAMTVTAQIMLAVLQ